MMARPTFIGWPLGSPVTLMMPPRPWIAKSYPAFSLSGPVWPYPVMDE